MRKVLLFFLALAAGASLALLVIAARFESKIAPRTFVGPVDVGGLTPLEASRKLRVWWESEKRIPLAVRSSILRRELPMMTASQLGVVIDDEQSVASLPTLDFVDTLRSGMSSQEPEVRVDPVYKRTGESLEPLEEEIKAAQPKPSPASARFVKGVIELHHESTGLGLAADELVPEVAKALKDRTLAIELPLVSSPKHVPDEALDTIQDVISSFSTYFPVRMTSRNNNIKVASEKLDGVVLMPGETASFNEIVGKRTVQSGFLEAGIYKNGKHDKGIGGGICQVSSTLYNAALFADLSIVKRHNHSMPVAYLPVGRDATVDYGQFDLALKNSDSTPIAISSEYRSGRLTFRILGKQDPTLKVKIITMKHKTWDRGFKVIQDPTLAPGHWEVTDKGSAGHSIYTFRLIYHDGVLTRREALGRSYYPGAPKLISCNGPYPPAKKSKESESGVESVRLAAGSLGQR